MDRGTGKVMDIDRKIAHVSELRENRRQVIVDQSLWQLLRELHEGEQPTQEEAERFVAAMTNAAREPLEERIALQQQEIAYLKQQVEYLTKRITGRLWP